MAKISEQMDGFWAGKDKADRINQAKGDLEGTLNLVRERAGQLQAMAAAGLFEGLAPEAQAAFKAGIKVLTDAEAAMQAKGEISELLAWRPKSS